MNEFKLSRKKIHNDNRSTIEEVHNKKMDEIMYNFNNIDLLKKKLLKLEQYYNILCKNQNNNEDKIKVSNNITELKNKIYQIESGNEIMDYIGNAWEFIIDNEKLDELKDNKEQTGIFQYIDKAESSTKGQNYHRYIDKCFNNINFINSSNNLQCKNCNSNQFFEDSGYLICNNCGGCKNYIDSSINGLNYDDMISYEASIQQFSYQRKNHFKEWLNQLQAKEVTNIPDSVINLLLFEIKKERIQNIEEIDSSRIKKYLKKLKLNKYYEHVPNIISKITKTPQLKITPQFEKILLDLFDLIQEPFEKHCPKTRKNFLSYSYTLHKFCQLLKKDEYLIYFPLLKSREKLFEQEKIWKEICKELNWEFKPCI